MAKKQTRKSISLNRQLYDQLKEYSEKSGISMAKIAEQSIKHTLSLAAE